MLKKHIKLIQRKTSRHKRLNRCYSRIVNTRILLLFLFYLSYRYYLSGIVTQGLSVKSFLPANEYHPLNLVGKKTWVTEY